MKTWAGSRDALKYDGFLQERVKRTCVFNHILFFLTIHQDVMVFFKRVKHACVLMAECCGIKC